jgi:hypothetical protein
MLAPGVDDAHDAVGNVARKGFQCAGIFIGEP